jgi:colanic acid/amylovoran biosynthesis glycosyltransferase
MRIAVVVSVFPTISETFVVNQITYLLDKGHEVTLLSYHKGSLAKVHQNITDYNLLKKCLYFKNPSKNSIRRYFQIFKLFYVSKIVNWSVLFSVFKNPNELWSLKLAFKSQWFLANKFDLIHIHFAPNARDIAFLKEKNIISIPYFISFHGYDIQPNLIENYKKDYKEILSNASKLIVNTRYTESLVKQLETEKDIIVLPVSLDTSKFKKINNLKKTIGFKILFCGRLINWKGPDITVEILNDLVNIKGYLDIELIIVGEGEYREKVVEVITKYKLNAYVKLLGALTQEEVLEQMNISDVFLLPGISEPMTDRAETQGLVIQEAQSMKLPVLVSDAGGMKYGVVDNETGFVIKENDIEEFSNKIELLYNNFDLKEKMGVNARKFVTENYDLNVLGGKLEQQFQDFLRSYNDLAYKTKIEL